MGYVPNRDQYIRVRTTQDGVESIDRMRGGWSRSEYVRQAVGAFIRSGRRGPDDEVAFEAVPVAPHPMDSPDRSTKVMSESGPHQRGRPHTPGYPLLDHEWVGTKARCMRARCPAPEDRARHPGPI